MKTARPKSTDELRMSAKEFDKIMRGALKVPLPEATKTKPTAKPKTTRKKAA